jgi:hypothetical protein
LLALGHKLVNCLVQLFKTPPRDLVPLVYNNDVPDLMPSSYVAIKGTARTLQHCIKVV